MSIKIKEVLRASGNGILSVSPIDNWILEMSDCRTLPLFWSLGDIFLEYEQELGYACYPHTSVLRMPIFCRPRVEKRNDFFKKMANE